MTKRTWLVLAIGVVAASAVAVPLLGLSWVSVRETHWDLSFEQHSHSASWSSDSRVGALAWSGPAPFLVVTLVSLVAFAGAVGGRTRRVAGAAALCGGLAAAVLGNLVPRFQHLFDSVDDGPGLTAFSVLALGAALLGGVLVIADRPGRRDPRCGGATPRAPVPCGPAGRDTWARVLLVAGGLAATAGTAVPLLPLAWARVSESQGACDACLGADHAPMGPAEVVERTIDPLGFAGPLPFVALGIAALVFGVALWHRGALAWRFAAGAVALLCASVAASGAFAPRGLDLCSERAGWELGALVFGTAAVCTAAFGLLVLVAPRR